MVVLIIFLGEGTPKDAAPFLGAAVDNDADKPNSLSEMQLIYSKDEFSYRATTPLITNSLERIQYGLAEIG
jgi:hypothetical protein